MILIDNVLISDDVVEEQFVCKLDACKGACCWEGDYGAPLTEEELSIVSDVYPKIRHLLSPEGIQAIEEKGSSVYYTKGQCHGTPLQPNEACAYMTFNEAGIAQCAFEKAEQQGITTFKKPISCHLYPVRISELAGGEMEAVNYDRWDICSAACTNGKALGVPVYQFVKDALIRKYGEAFYEELDAAVKHKHRID